jgi:hypothetical protein
LVYTAGTFGTVNGGSITILSNGTYTYTPPLNYEGPDRYVYQVCDNGMPSLCSNATAYFLIAGTADVAIIKTASPNTAKAGGSTI